MDHATGWTTMSLKKFAHGSIQNF